MKKRGRRLLLALLILAVLGAAALWAADAGVEAVGRKTMVAEEDASESRVILVLGAHVTSTGQVSIMLRDRLECAYRLYMDGKAPKILVSGDHGRKDYDEVNAMRSYLLNKGVPSEDIFMDHAGFDTYDSIYRTKAIFEAENAIIVTQEFHVLRALYIADRLGLSATGVACDTYVYPDLTYLRIREVGARMKAFLQAGVFKPNPRFLGDTISLFGSGEVTLG